jgi:hypothetical protein
LGIGIDIAEPILEIIPVGIIQEYLSLRLIPRTMM